MPKKTRFSESESCMNGWLSKKSEFDNDLRGNTFGDTAENIFLIQLTLENSDCQGIKKQFEFDSLTVRVFENWA